MEQQYTQQYQQPYLPQPPQRQLPTDRNLGIVILLSIVTLGIYGIVFYYQIGDEINLTASRADGKQTMNYVGCIFLSLVTLGIYGLVWMHKMSERVGDEAARRNTGVQFSAADFWLWSVLLSCTVVGAFIGPFVYQYKLIQASNAINLSYNIYG